mmetsp:Transcript_13399/g.42103  ORF Transcript_13399/g.42103 Transcript_13399/m.42103 type:complete len:209 (-) Transcript_13399:218-844(-)
MAMRCLSSPATLCSRNSRRSSLQSRCPRAATMAEARRARMRRSLIPTVSRPAPLTTGGLTAQPAVVAGRAALPTQAASLRAGFGSAAASCGAGGGVGWCSCRSTSCPSSTAAMPKQQRPCTPGPCCVSTLRMQRYCRADASVLPCPGGRTSWSAMTRPRSRPGSAGSTMPWSPRLASGSPGQVRPGWQRPSQRGEAPTCGNMCSDAIA